MRLALLLFACYLIVTASVQHSRRKAGEGIIRVEKPAAQDDNWYAADGEQFPKRFI